MAHHLLLFINSDHPLSASWIADAKRLLAGYSADGHELDVKDIAKDLEEAEVHRILATPTLIRLDVTPTRRVIGDLSNTERVARALGFD